LVGLAIVVFIRLGSSLLLSQALNILESADSVAVQSMDWIQLLTVVIVGLLIALAVQFLLFLFGSAIALSILPIPSFEGTPEPPNASVRTLPISALAGFGVLSTVNTVLFVASFLAITLIHSNQPISGAISGIVLWAVYCLLVLWLSLKTITNWSETFLNISTAGLRRFLSLLSKTFQQQQDEQVLLPGQIKVIIQEEVQTALVRLQQQIRQEQQPLILQALANNQHEIYENTESMSQKELAQSVQTTWLNIQQYLGEASVKSLSPKQLDRTLQQYLEELPIERMPASFLTIDIQDLFSILSARNDLSAKKQKRIVQQVETAWQTYTNALVKDAIDHTVKLESSPSSSTAESSANDHAAFPLSDPQILQAALDKLTDQILPQLSAGVQQNWPNLLPLAKTVAQANLEETIAPVQDIFSATNLKHQAEQLLEQSQSNMADLNSVIEQKAGEFRDRATEQLLELQQAIQQNTQTRLAALRRETQTRLAATRKTLATVLWWLFATACTGGISAALAGAIAAGFNPLELFP